MAVAAAAAAAVAEERQEGQAGGLPAKERSAPVAREALAGCRLRPRRQQRRGDS